MGRSLMLPYIGQDYFTSTDVINAIETLEVELEIELNSIERHSIGRELRILQRLEFECQQYTKKWYHAAAVIHDEWLQKHQFEIEGVYRLISFEDEPYWLEL